MVVVDADHRGPLVNLAAWITIVVAVLVGVGKIITKWRITSELYADDGYMAISLVLAIGSTCAVTYQVSFGLGSHVSTLSPESVDNFQKALLATDILYVATIFSAKMSLVGFLRNFTLPRDISSRRKIVDCYLIGLLTWTVVAIFAVAFRCEAPLTWNVFGNKCYDFPVFWTVNTVVDVVTQVVLSILPVVLLWDVNMVKEKKRLAILSYVPIITTIPFEMLRIVSIWHSLPNDDLTMATYWPSMYTIIHANYSVIASCSTFLIPIVEALSVGLISAKVALVPKLDNPHITRGQGPFNPLIVIGGRNVLTPPHTQDEEEGGTPKSGDQSLRSSRRQSTLRPISTNYSRSPSSRNNSIFYNGNVRKDPTELALDEIERFGSSDAMVVNSPVTQWAFRSNSLTTADLHRELVDEGIVMEIPAPTYKPERRASAF